MPVRHLIVMDGGRGNAGNSGLPVYPEAQRTRDTHDGDADRANVSIGTPWFGLHVIAAEYESEDPPERILSFYRGSNVLRIARSVMDEAVALLR